MSAASRLRERLAEAGVALTLDGNDNLEWQAAADPPPDLLAEARRLKPALLELLRVEASNANAPAPADGDVETLAHALMAEAERNPAVRRLDEAKALTYSRGEALRRLDLIRQRAIDATTGPDIERQAIEAEETAPMAGAEAHAEAVAGLLLASSPLAGIPGAVACRSCGRRIWCSPSWRGSLLDLCWDCWRKAP